MFDLKRPCATCPFRIGQGEKFQLAEGRIEEIVGASAFQCHKTVDYDAGGDDDEGAWSAGDKPQQCAGLMAILEREGMPNQMMRIAGRIGVYKPDEIDPRGEAYASIEEAMQAHRRRRA